MGQINGLIIDFLIYNKSHIFILKSDLYIIYNNVRAYNKNI